MGDDMDSILDEFELDDGPSPGRVRKMSTAYARSSASGGQAFASSIADRNRRLKGWRAELNTYKAKKTMERRK